MKKIVYAFIKRSFYNTVTKRQGKMVTLYLQYCTIVSQKQFATQYRRGFLSKGIQKWNKPSQ